MGGRDCRRLPGGHPYGQAAALKRAESAEKLLTRVYAKPTETVKHGTVDEPADVEAVSSQNREKRRAPLRQYAAEGRLRVVGEWPSTAYRDAIETGARKALKRAEAAERLLTRVYGKPTETVKQIDAREPESVEAVASLTRKERQALLRKYAAEGRLRVVGE